MTFALNNPVSFNDPTGLAPSGLFPLAAFADYENERKKAGMLTAEDRGNGDDKRGTKSSSNGGTTQLWIIATQIYTVNGTEIKDTDDFLAYSLEFRLVTLPTSADENAKVETLEFSSPIIMFENKTEQEGKSYSLKHGRNISKKGNAFKDGTIYSLKAVDYVGSIPGKESFDPAPTDKSFLAKGVLIHPSHGSDHLAGCKSFCYEKDVMVSKGALKPKRDEKTNSSLTTSYKAFKEIHDNIANFNIKDGNIFLKVNKSTKKP
jgi:hypothetical protein